MIIPTINVSMISLDFNLGNESLSNIIQYCKVLLQAGSVIQR